MINLRLTPGALRLAAGRSIFTGMADVTHAGGIVMRLEDGRPRYLVVTAKNNPDRWLFPKGHIDPGETPEAAAEREVLEEAGVEATILKPVGLSEFEKNGGRRIRAQFFLMRYVRDGGPGEDRRRRWCAYEEAQALLSWETSRELLRRAHALIT